MPAPTPAPDVSAGSLRFPWSLGNLRNVPSHLLGCLGSCTIVGQKECESCIADKEKDRERSSEDDENCDEDDENEEDNEGRGRGNRCGRSR